MLSDTPEKNRLSFFMVTKRGINTLKKKKKGRKALFCTHKILDLNG